MKPKGSPAPQTISADTADALMAMLAMSGSYAPDAVGVDCIHPQRTITIVLAHQLTATVAARLAVVPDIAYVKYLNDLPIDDPRREAQLVDKFVAEAAHHGVPAQLARGVICAQLEAAKHVQYELFFQWLSGTRLLPDRPVRALADMRSEIDAATDLLSLQLAAAYRGSLPSDWSQQLEIAARQARPEANDEVTTASFNEALAPLKHMA